jgi:hypothetical protein
VTPGRSAVRRTMAEKRPNSVSLSPSAFSEEANWNNDDTNSDWKYENQRVQNKRDDVATHLVQNARCSTSHWFKLRVFDVLTKCNIGTIQKLPISN